MELKQLLDTIREETASSHAETRQQFVVATDRIRREFAVNPEGLQHELILVTESLRREIQAVAKGVTIANGRLDRIDMKVDKIADHGARLTRLEAAASRRPR